MYENQPGFFEEERELKSLWCVSYEYGNLQEQKPDRDCDDWENGPLTESIIASVKKRSHLTSSLAVKTVTRLSPFRVFL